MVPAKTDCDYITRRECDNMHNSSKFIQGGIVTLFLGMLAVGVWFLQIAGAADARSQRNESSIENIQSSIAEVKITINRGFDELKAELKEQRNNEQ